MFSRKYHFFYLTYADKTGNPHGVVLRFPKPFVTDKNLHMGRTVLELPNDAPVLAVSYLGHMSLKQWNNPA